MEKEAPEIIPGLIPASMLSVFAYCPRLCYLQWVQGEFQDSPELAEGRFLHRFVDAEMDAIPEGFQPFHARSVSLTAPHAGICCKIDLLEGDGNCVTPVEYKRGETPKHPQAFYEPYQIQLCAQCLALRENGFQCDEGIAYFFRSKERVAVRFDPELVRRTVELLSSIRIMAKKGEMPPPLRSSSRCNQCSLAGICLPDEVNLLKQMDEENRPEVEHEEVRKLHPSRDDALPIYVIGQGHIVRKRGERLEIWNREEKVSEARFMEVSQVNLYGGVEITTPATVELMQRGAPVLHFTHGGWFQGICVGMSNKNVELRIRQFEWARDKDLSLSIARSLIYGKIKNCRTNLRRDDPDVPQEVLESLEKLSLQAKNASLLQSLLGIEGSAAEIYFSRFGSMLKGYGGFSFQNRNKRPPRDPVNTVLSYLYSVLTKELFVTVLAVGFDPYLGFYHQPKYGRPALALDMMEEFRPIIADSVAITLFNKKELTEEDFIKTGIGISLSSESKRKVISAYEQRMQTEITHPIFEYTLSYRRILEVQVRLLSRVLSGELKEYPAFLTR